MNTHTFLLFAARWSYWQAKCGGHHTVQSLVQDLQRALGAGGQQLQRLWTQGTQLQRLRTPRCQLKWLRTTRAQLQRCLQVH
jgi:hypothetical protein